MINVNFRELLKRDEEQPDQHGHFTRWITKFFLDQSNMPAIVLRDEIEGAVFQWYSFSVKIDVGEEIAIGRTWPHPRLA